MHWNVEVTSMGKSGAEAFDVEADTWQGALAAVRAKQGDAGSMSGFSVEVLGDAYRAVDATARRVYVLKAGGNGVARAAVAAVAPVAPVVPRPAAPAFPVFSNESADATIPQVQVLREAPEPPPPTQVIFKREHERSVERPITYREYVYAVGQGSSEAQAEQLLIAQLELIRRSIENTPAGKFVNLAVFDVVFQGKPPMPPLATLAWKDWKGPPVVDFPRRRVSEPGSFISAVPDAPSDPPPAVAPPPPPPAPVSVPAVATSPSVRTRTGRSSLPNLGRGRVRGDELIATLFEAMHDLHFMSDALEGADYCLMLALEVLPSQGAIAHLYDIDRREFLIVRTRGADARGILLLRHPESDVLLSRAMRARRALIVAKDDVDGTRLERFAPFGGCVSVIVAPVMQSGRFLGAIEIVNPVDLVPYTEDERNAVHYIAEQYAEFVADRGIVTEPERIVRQAGRA